MLSECQQIKTQEKYNKMVQVVESKHN